MSVPEPLELGAARALRVLVVEDTIGFADALRGQLVRAGHFPKVVTHVADALTAYHDADLVLLDLWLPDGHGFDVLRAVRADSSVPVLVFTAYGDERILVRSLRLGADDYLAKPFRRDELLARIDAVMRRVALRARPLPRVVTAGDVLVDLEARRVTVDGTVVDLTPKEFTVLAVLARHQGSLVTRADLLDAGWGDTDPTRDRSLSVAMTTLRKKLARPGLIRTEHGLGYRLEV